MAVELIKKDLWVPDQVKNYDPKSGFGKYVKDCLHYLPPIMAAELVERISSIVVIETELRLKVLRGRDGLDWTKLIKKEVSLEDYGIVGNKVVTTVGVNFIVDAFQNIVELEIMKFHGIGTGVTAEAVGDTALVTELTTEYNPDSTRATGTTTEFAANVYQTVATNTLDGTPGAALREHGIFTLSSAGVLLDRTLFAAITLSSGDGLQSDYRFTVTSGG